MQSTGICHRSSFKPLDERLCCIIQLYKWHCEIREGPWTRHPKNRRATWSVKRQEPVIWLELHDMHIPCSRLTASRQPGSRIGNYLSEDFNPDRARYSAWLCNILIKCWSGLHRCFIPGQAASERVTSFCSTVHFAEFVTKLVLLKFCKIDLYSYSFRKCKTKNLLQ